jgi:hypothetical protein
VVEPIIKKPFKNLDVEFQKYSINAEKGDKFTARSGSYIEFPPNAFVDKNGELIKGNVKVKSPSESFIDSHRLIYFWYPDAI